MKPSRNLFLRSASLAAILALGGMQSAHAAALTWTGATNSDLNTTTNWSTNTDPSGDNLIFSNNVNTTIGISSDITIAGVANGISFNTGAGAFTIGALGTSRKLTFGTFTNNGINVASTVTTDQTINANLTFGGDNTVNTFRIQNYGTGLLKINGTVGSGGTGKTLALAGTGNIELTNTLGAAASTALNVTSTGIVTLSGTNTYAGKVTVSSGALVFQKKAANSASAPGTNTVAAGATLGLGVGSTTTYYGVTDVTKLLNGTLTEFSSISATANVGVDTTAGNFDYTASAPSTTRGLMKLGANTLTLSGTNAYTGVTMVRQGTLEVNSSGVINNAATSGATGIVIGGSTLDINGGTVNFNGGTALAVGDNTTAGNVIVRAGSNLNLTGAIAIGQGSSTGNTPVSTFTQYGGTTTIGATSTLYLGNFRGGTMDIQGGSLTSASAANIGVRGNSTLTISGESTAVTFSSIAMGNVSGDTNATSDVNLNGGTLTLGASGFTIAATAGAKTVNFDGGTLKASATSTDFVNATSVYVKAGGATIDTDVNDVTIDNQLLQSGATTGALTKTGAGKLTLSAANTYTGTTTIDTGTLALGTGGSINNSSGVNLVNGGHFNVSAITTTTSYSVASLSGNGSVTGDLTVTGALGIGASPGTVTFNDDLTLGGFSVSTFEINDLTSLYDLAKGGTGSQTVTFGGTLILNFLGGFNTTGSVKIFDFEIYDGDFNLPITTNGLASGYTATFNSDTGFVTVVPEPSAALIGGLGLLCLLRRRR